MSSCLKWCKLSQLDKDLTDNYRGSDEGPSICMAPPFLTTLFWQWPRYLGHFDLILPQIAKLSSTGIIYFCRVTTPERVFLTAFGLVMTLTFDALTSKSNPFIFVSRFTKVVNLVQFPQPVYKLFCSQTVFTNHVRMHKREENPKTVVHFQHRSDGVGDIETVSFRGHPCVVFSGDVFDIIVTNTRRVILWVLTLRSLVLVLILVMATGTWITGTGTFTVCTAAQNCCNGRSKKYRKWHFWGCSSQKPFNGST